MPKKKHPAHHDGPPMPSKGVVTSLHSNKHDEFDGFELKNGTVVKFPPQNGHSVSELVTEGCKVRVKGRRHQTPHGDIHLQADRIIVDDVSLELDKPKRGGPKHSPPMDGPSNADIMRELKKLRRLIENLKGQA